VQIKEVRERMVKKPRSMFISHDYIMSQQKFK